MTFSEKFDWLMGLTGTPNSLLARVIEQDPSYISRLRHGKRGIPKHADFLEGAAAFFVEQCTTEYRKKALLEMAGEHDPAAFDAPEQLARKLARWLMAEIPDRPDPVGLLLNDMSGMSGKKMPAKQPSRTAQGDMLVFYGEEGRRQAAAALLALALQQDGPATLMLYSDESKDWQHEVSPFSYEWAGALWQIILRGGRIRVIHKISQDLDEMLGVVRLWLPFYASGAVEPYYYPKLRDGVYKRTLSVVAGVGAAFSTSIGQQSGGVPTFLTTERMAVDSFTNEFTSYLSLCCPLVHIHAQGTPRYAQALQDYVGRGASSILQTDCLPLVTAPEDMLEALYARTPAAEREPFRRFCGEYRQRAAQHVNEHDLFHLLRLESPESIRGGKVLFSCLNLPAGTPPLAYTPRWYAEHLRNTLQMLEDCAKYHICILREEPAGYTVRAFEGGEVFILRESPANILFRVTESTMASAFWDFLVHKRDSMARTNRRQTATAIRELLEQFEIPE
ncbi:putative transcriptional regulator [uncultured delta proteobacterium]|uniref:Putative transcriptional regulator n=1 Tax=uncultured delta proteobacterium TaxID=34034 RepID=A0A212KH26_9DELT|nr:putative transcriptional regulator [uncultured delta proteobacterium]